MTYIYGLFCPIAKTIRYVGKANDPERRLLNHVWACEKNAHHAARWLAVLKRKGLQPELIVLAEVGVAEIGKRPNAVSLQLAHRWVGS